MASPLQRVGPGLITKPVADVVNITSIDEDGELLKNLGHKLVERLHPVTGKHEVSVDVKVASLVAVDLNTKGVHNILLVEVLGDPAKSSIAEVGRVLTLATDIVDVATSALVRSDHGIVAVNGGGNA